MERLAYIILFIFITGVLSVNILFKDKYKQFSKEEIEITEYNEKQKNQKNLSFDEELDSLELDFGNIERHYRFVINHRGFINHKSRLLLLLLLLIRVKL